MARPIKETPILYGEDARRFAERAEWVENLPMEVRRENWRKVQEGYEQAKKYINFHW